MSIQQEFLVGFDGPALREGLMEVEDLAPAMLAFGQLVRRSAQVVSDDDSLQVSVKASAGFERGSFGILMVVDVGFVDQTIEFLKTAAGVSKDAKEIWALLFGAGGVFWWLKNRGKAEVVERGEDSILVNVEGNNNQVVVSREVLDAVADEKVVQHSRAVLKPLRTPGVDVFYTADEEAKRIEVMRKRELEQVDTVFSAPAVVEEPASEGNVTKHYLELATVPLLSPGNKWQFDTGDGRISATMSDETFLRQVENREVAFLSGDVLEVLMETRSAIRNGKPHVEHEIIEVLGKIDLPTQLDL